MKVLLDTCTFLWLISDSKELTPKSRELFSDPYTDVYLSVISSWEIAMKFAMGRLLLTETPSTFIPMQREKHGVDCLDLDEASALHVAKLPDLHKDPFDRMLISQALVHGMTILTPDPQIAQYPVQVVW